MRWLVSLLPVAQAVSGYRRCAHAQSSRCVRVCERVRERTTISAFHLLMIPSHLPLITTYLPPGSRDAIRRVLAAEEDQAHLLPAPNQPSSSSPTVCTLILYSVCYRPFARSPRIALATGAFALPPKFPFRCTQRQSTHFLSHTLFRVAVHVPHPLAQIFPPTRSLSP